jgi:UDP-GlcNAc:undecaprenyl-phosphate/decaprenyl-phosphate GlcNAc-1-phosphate transferase
MTFLAFVLSFLLTIAVLPPIIRLAERKRIFDPSDDRKRHNRHVSALGGVGIFIGLVVSSAVFLPTDVRAEFIYLFSAYLLTFLLGILDDLKQTRSWLKFIIQIAAAFLLVVPGGIQFSSFQGLFTFFGLAEYSSIFFSMVFILLIINAFNFIDGIDSLSGTLGVLFLTAAAFWFYWSGDEVWLIISLSLIGGLIAFLFYNIHPAKIFMGDNGSQSIGLLIGAMAIHGIEGQIGGHHYASLLSGPAVAFSLLSIPLFDMLRVIILRVKSERFPFSPDHNHIHHLLIARGFSNNGIVLMLSLFTAGLFLLNLLCDALRIGVNYMMAGDFILTGLFFLIILRKKQASAITNPV